ncbi:MAG: hypothetical protein A3G20_05725 [Acidobacteria bacterium RIFCSPLOWO2_12_FULL_59_11]|nr:MAG: hypothetical protein A3G20_05725 [Acidobacteria bacterium RIFCSPLOWO2_12_FULL_59_11]
MEATGTNPRIYLGDSYQQLTMALFQDGNSLTRLPGIAGLLHGADRRLIQALLLTQEILRRRYGRMNIGFGWWL